MPGGPDVKWSATAGGTGAGEAVISGVAAWDVGDIEATASGLRGEPISADFDAGMACRGGSGWTKEWWKKNIIVV